MWKDLFVRRIGPRSACACREPLPEMHTKNRARTVFAHCRQCVHAITYVLQQLLNEGQWQLLLQLQQYSGMPDAGVRMLQEAQQWSRNHVSSSTINVTTSTTYIAQEAQPRPQDTVYPQQALVALDVIHQIPEAGQQRLPPASQYEDSQRDAGAEQTVVTVSQPLLMDTQYTPVLSSSSDGEPVRAPRANTIAGLMQQMRMPGYHITDQRSGGGSRDGMSVHEFILKFLEWKQSYNVTDAAGNDILRFITSQLLNFNHLYPHSWHLIRGLVEPEDDLQYQHAMCLCEQAFWTPIPDECQIEPQVFGNVVDFEAEVQQLTGETQSEYTARLQLVRRHLLCNCGRQRFRMDDRGRYLHSGVRYYYFGVERQLRKLFANASWAKYFQKDMDRTYYFESTEFQRLCRKLQSQGIDKDDCVFIDLAHDGFMPFKATSSRHSWGVWMRVKNVDPSIHFRYFNVRELALWPQATKPRTDGVLDKVNVQLGFKQIVDELFGLCIAGQPMQVWDASQQRMRGLYVVLASMMQDSPGRQKVMGGGGVQAYFSCQWCVMESIPVSKGQMAEFRQSKRDAQRHKQPRKKQRTSATTTSKRYRTMEAVDAQEEEAELSAAEQEQRALPADTLHAGGRATRYPVGYVRPICISRYALTHKLRGFMPHQQQYGVRVGDACIKLTNAQQRYRMSQAALSQATDALQLYGCRGHCDFLRLFYISYNDLFVLPTYHMLLYGVLRTFWRYALNADNRMITRADLQTMQQREQGMVTVSDISERYDGIKRGMARWQLKHWMYWADVWFSFVCLGVTFHGTLPSDADRVKPPPSVVPATTFTQLVHQLHASVLWFVRPQDSATESEVRRHHYVLHHFAQAIELTCGPGQQTTTNLHFAVCRLGDQCRTRGHSGHEGELWVERCILVMNQVIGTAHTAFPEKTLVKRLLLDDAIVRQFKVRNMEGNDIDSIALTRDSRVAQHAIQQPDNVDIWLLGKQYWPTFQAYAGRFSTLQIVAKALGQRQFRILTKQQAEQLNARHLLFHPRAEIGGAIVIHAQSGSQESVAESHWVLIEWQAARGQVAVPTIGRVLTFLRFSKAGRQELGLGMIPFIALVQLYRCEQVDSYGRSVYCIQEGVFAETSVSSMEGLRGVAVSAIHAKLHRFVDTSRASRTDSTHSYFTSYQCTTLT